MSETPETPDSKTSTTLLPSQEDVKLWRSLSSEEQDALIARELETARKRGINPDSYEKMFQSLLSRLRNTA